MPEKTRVYIIRKLSQSFLAQLRKEKREVDKRIARGKEYPGDYVRQFKLDIFIGFLVQIIEISYGKTA